MKNLERINFKKIFTLYIVIAVITGVIAGSFLWGVFGEKIIFANDYHNVSKNIQKNKGVTNEKDLENKLDNLANKSNDIVDILVLDKDNKIVYSAKNSNIASSNEFILEKALNSEGKFLVTTDNPNNYFKVVKNDKLLINKDMIEKEKEIKSGYDDEMFFKDDFNNKNVFKLSYVINKETGNKVYFISNIIPVINGELYLKIVAVLGTLLFMAYWVLTALYVFTNARKAKLNCNLWGILTLFTNLVGVIIYMIYKQNNKSCTKCGVVQGKYNIYCISCGEKIGKNCNICNTVINDNDVYCKRCGEKIEH